MKSVDIPPVWLALALAAVWQISRRDPLQFNHPLTDLMAGILIGGGVVLMVLAFVEMRKWRTTVVPHRDASHLVTSGIFKRTRNPIYLGDALVLGGAILRFGSPLSLAVLALFVWWIERHFILTEEDRLRRRYRADFGRYCEKTRRWL